MPRPNDGSGYIHGYSDAEAERLLEQAEFLARWVMPGVDLDGVERLLEPGVGVGAETRLLLRRWPSLRIVGVDVSEDSLARARRVLDGDVARGAVSLVRASAAALPLDDAAFDGAFVCWLLEHVPDAARVVAECARCLRPGGRLSATEVYNTSLYVEPRRPIIDRYFAAVGEAQRASGGHPEIGARLGELAARAGLRVERLRFVPVLGDGRDPDGRAALIRYFRELLRSAAPQVRAAGTFPDADLPELWAAFADVERAPDALLCYTFAQLDARKP
ncbi:MAG TPA: methyltransferase domain-containing protein [Polyangia bacterium]|nr:methyltransferase domain-containing protein [Polyangia bacterium]